MRYIIKFEEEIENASSPEEAAEWAISRLRKEEFSVDVIEGEGEDKGEYITTVFAESRDIDGHCPLCLSDLEHH